jgi:CheY-like chemotaxis protein
MNDITSDLKQRLEGKTVLFVDDQKVTVGDYMRRLQAIDIACESTSSLDEAFYRIGKHDEKPLGLILIDLNMPSTRLPVLSKYLSKINATPTSRDLGRALGLYLWNKKPKIPYCYFSALSMTYTPIDNEFNGKDNLFILDKVTIVPSQFPPELYRVLIEWDEIMVNEDE